MLDRYKNLSSKIKVDYVDPEKKPDIARVEGARSHGRHHRRQRREERNRQRPDGRRADRARWCAVSKSGARTACFVNGSGEHTLADTGREGYSTLKDALEKNNYKTETISLIEKPEIPKTCNIVVVGGPKHDYLQPAIDALKNLRQGGGRAIFNFDPVLNLPDQKMGDTPDLAKLVADWGVTPNGDVVLDLSSASRLFGQISPVVGLLRAASDRARHAGQCDGVPAGPQSRSEVAGGERCSRPPPTVTR